MKNKRKIQMQIQLERLKHFSHQPIDYYEEKKVGNDWYVKNYNGGTDQWQVSVYSPESFRKYKQFNEARKRD